MFMETKVRFILRLGIRHSMGYWLWANLIAPESERLLKNVVRVYKQEEADILFFYMGPFTRTPSPSWREEGGRHRGEVLEAKIGNWIRFVRISVKLSFAGEKKIYDENFEGHDDLRDQCFAKVTANSMAFLLSFGKAITKIKRSPEKLFVLLDMYEIMRELQPEMDAILRSKFCGEMREAFVVLTKRLVETTQETFGDFAEAVEKDATKTTVSWRNSLPPLRSYVINYVKFLFDYHSSMLQLFKVFHEASAVEQLANITTRIMQALQTNLDERSKQYKDPALTQLFLMNNNMHYIVRSVGRSEVKDLSSDD